MGSTVEILTMLASWFSGIGATAAVLYAVNTNRSGLKCYPKQLGHHKNNIHIELFNHKPVKAHITDIRLELVDETKFGRDDSVSLSIYNDIIGMCMEPGQRFKLSLSYATFEDNHTKLFHWFKVENVPYMPRVRLSIYILNGKRIDIGMPFEFYPYYIDGILERSSDATKRYNCNSLGEMSKRIDGHMKTYRILLLIKNPKLSLRGLVHKVRSQSLISSLKCNI